MGIYDRDYMRRGGDEPPPDEPLEDRLAGRLTSFVRQHPKMLSATIGILVALAILAVLAAVL